MKKYKDKLFHAIVSCGIMLVFLWLYGSFWPAFILTLSAGIAKEVYDSYQKDNYFDWWDIVADLVGIIIGSWIWKM